MYRETQSTKQHPSNYARILESPKNKISDALRPKSKITYAMPSDPLIKAVLIDAFERLAGRGHFEQAYDYVLDKYDEICVDFWWDALEKLQIKVDYDETQLAKVPQDRPVVFLANHPYGLADGIISAYLVHRSRHSFQIMINSALCREAIFENCFLPISFEPTKEAIQTTIRSKKKAIRTLNRNGAVMIFPAGGPSVSPRGFGLAHDLEWKLFAAKMVQVSHATVVPMFFTGQNSRAFQVLSHVNGLIRASMLLPEMKRLRGKTIRVEIGDPISYDSVRHIKGRQALLTYFRQQTYLLGNIEHSPVSTLHWYK